MTLPSWSKQLENIIQNRSKYWIQGVTVFMILDKLLKRCVLQNVYLESGDGSNSTPFIGLLWGLNVVKQVTQILEPRKCQSVVVIVQHSSALYLMVTFAILYLTAWLIICPSFWTVSLVKARIILLLIVEFLASGTALGMYEDSQQIFAEYLTE